MTVSHWSHVYTQHLVAPPDRVLPLLTPIGEKAWARGWDPTILHDAPGLVGTVFRTSAAGRPDTIWLCERYAPDGVRYTRVTPGSDVTEIEVALAATSAGCDATVRYTFTTIGALGAAVVDRFTSAYWLELMRTWEEDLNRCLRA